MYDAPKNRAGMRSCESRETRIRASAYLEFASVADFFVEVGRVEFCVV